MIPTPNELWTLCGLAETAATAAAQWITERWGDPGEIRWKTPNSRLPSSAVTDVDRRCQEIILEILAPVLQTGTMGLLTEETSDDGSRFSRPIFWCIDPLDGTLAFSQQLPGVAVSIALVSRNGEPLIGVVAEPRTGRIFTGIRRNGSREDDQPLTCGSSMSSASSSLTVVFDRHYLESPDYPVLRARWQDFCQAEGFSQMRIHAGGGAVMNALAILENPPACYVKLPQPSPGGGALWDYAATDLLVREAGGTVTDLFGEPLDLNRRDSLYLNHRGVLYATDDLLTQRITRAFAGNKPTPLISTRT